MSLITQEADCCTGGKGEEGRGEDMTHKVQVPA